MSSVLKILIVPNSNNSKIFFIFFLLMIAVTILNTVVLCFSSAGMSSDLKTIIKITNYVCTSIFVLESIIKIIAIGIKPYFQSNFNIADFVLNIIGICEILLNEYASFYCILLNSIRRI